MGVPDHSDPAALRRWLLGIEAQEEKSEEKAEAQEVANTEEADKGDAAEAKPKLDVPTDAPVAEDTPLPDAAEAQGKLEVSLDLTEDALSRIPWGSGVGTVVAESALRMIPDLQSTLQWSICRSARGPDCLAKKKSSSPKTAEYAAEGSLTATQLNQVLMDLRDSLANAKAAGVGIPMSHGPAAVAVQSSLQKLRSAALAEADLAFAVAQRDKALLPRALRLAEHQGVCAASVANGHTAMMGLMVAEKNLEEALEYAEGPEVDAGEAEVRLTAALATASTAVPKATLATAEAKLRALVDARRTAEAEKALGVRAAVQGAWDNNGKVIKIQGSLVKQRGEDPISLDCTPGGDIRLGSLRGRLVCSEGGEEQHIAWDNGESWPRSTLSDEQVEAELAPAAATEEMAPEPVEGEPEVGEAPQEEADPSATTGEAPPEEAVSAADPEAPATEGEDPVAPESDAAVEPTPVPEEGANTATE